MILQFVSEGSPDAGQYSQKEIALESETAIHGPADVCTFFGDFFNRKKQEYFCALNLDGSAKVISARIITIGLLNHTLVHPREVFRDAILDGSASIIVVHNHPSGSLEPSTQDITITRQLKEAGDIIGIRVLDHIIMGKEGEFWSFHEKGMI